MEIYLNKEDKDYIISVLDPKIEAMKQAVSMLHTDELDEHIISTDDFDWKSLSREEKDRKEDEALAEYEGVICFYESAVRILRRTEDSITLTADEANRIDRVVRMSIGDCEDMRSIKSETGQLTEQDAKDIDEDMENLQKCHILLFAGSDK